jgi:hypothetical protein
LSLLFGQCRTLSLFDQICLIVLSNSNLQGSSLQLNALTIGRLHYNNAHNNARTQEINEQYQHILLLAKADIIKWNIETDDIETIYEFEKFVLVLRAGFDDDTIDLDNLNFVSIVKSINQYYS